MRATGPCGRLEVPVLFRFGSMLGSGYWLVRVLGADPGTVSSGGAAYFFFAPSALWTFHSHAI
jgi:hypothetical protein